MLQSTTGSTAALRHKKSNRICAKLKYLETGFLIHSNLRQDTHSYGTKSLINSECNKVIDSMAGLSNP